jgi:predicted ABC-type exoprotein transport system permease subunit
MRSVQMCVVFVCRPMYIQSVSIVFLIFGISACIFLIVTKFKKQVANFKREREIKILKIVLNKGSLYLTFMTYYVQS